MSGVNMANILQPLSERKLELCKYMEYTDGGSALARDDGSELKRQRGRKAEANQVTLMTKQFEQTLLQGPPRELASNPRQCRLHILIATRIHLPRVF